jgi:glycerol-3-phosphate dehydrogenase
MKRIAILGGGSWGTALAIVLSRTHKPLEISLWVRNASLAESIRRDRQNKLYLPDHTPLRLWKTPEWSSGLSPRPTLVGFTGACFRTSLAVQLSSAPRKGSSLLPTRA